MEFMSVNIVFTHNNIIFTPQPTVPVLPVQPSPVKIWTNNEVNRELGRLWKQLSSEERQRYHTLADEDKARYLKVKGKSRLQ